jgi:hypothetical protein
VTTTPDPGGQQVGVAEEQLRAALLERLLTSSVAFNYRAMSTAAHEYGCHPSEVAQALWGLAAEGLAFLDPSGQPSPEYWQWRASRHARAAAQDGEWEPQDPRGFLTRLQQQSPTLDPVALRYVQEALRCFAGGSYLGTSVMIGVASEQAVLIAARAVVDAVSAPKLAEKVNGSRAKQGEVFEELRKRLEPMRRDLPEGLADVLTLDAVADLLRVNRNEAGHPTGLHVDRDTARIHLQMAAVYLGKLASLTEHFRRQQPETVAAR